MWTTCDPRCSRCLRLSRSGWGQLVASSPDQAAPHGGHSLSPAPQQLVPMVVPKGPRARPSGGGRPPAGARQAVLLPPGAEPKLGSCHRGRPKVAARYRRNAERKLALRAAASSVRLPGTRARHSRRAPPAAPFHSLHSLPLAGVRAHAGIGQGAPLLPAAPWEGHGRRPARHPSVELLVECSLELMGGDHGHRGRLTRRRLTRRRPSVVRWARSGLSIPIHGSHIGSDIARLVPCDRGEMKVGIGCRDPGRILKGSLGVRRARSRRRIVPPAALTPAFAGPYHRCFGAILAPTFACLPP
jgi:hypothetical protein